MELAIDDSASIHYRALCGSPRDKEEKEEDVE